MQPARNSADLLPRLAAIELQRMEIEARQRQRVESARSLDLQGAERLAALELQEEEIFVAQREKKLAAGNYTEDVGSVPQRSWCYKKLRASRKTSSEPSSRYRMSKDVICARYRHNKYVAARRERQRRTVPRSVTHQPLVPAQRAARIERRPRPSELHKRRVAGLRGAPAPSNGCVLLCLRVHRLFELLEEEGICDIRIARACFNAFQIAAVVGDKARAKVFAERAYAARKVLAGNDNPMTIAFKHFAQQPVDYPQYGERFNCWDDS
ncbi:hypothetical protein BKA61DRAFT_659660 [Leptodontidium sp. MPI-SDFR-AT-0119]|nr:hypothetical protein BKA61DRAFT_659660 [Leptodontidium sp. MPI-SDFR-AT-0119]